MAIGGKKDSKARAALAKSNTVTLLIEGPYETDRQKFVTILNELGLEFAPGSTETLISNDVNDHIGNTSGNPHGTVLTEVTSVDTVPTDGSTNPVESNGIFDALANKLDTTSADQVPVNGSTNYVESNGIFDALASKQDAVSGYTGSFFVVTDVDFDNESTTVKQITIANGIVTNVV